MMFFWIPLLFVVPFLLFGAYRREGGVGCCGMTHDMNSQAPGPQGPQPIEIARQRLARGEITVEEFETIKRVLG